MKKIATLALFGLAISLGAHAADAPSDGRTKQQNRMKTCSADAKGKSLKGDDRKAYMKTCLSSKSAATVAKQ